MINWSILSTALKYIFNLFYATGLFLDPLKASGNLCLQGVWKETSNMKYVKMFVVVSGTTGLALYMNKCQEYHGKIVWPVM